MMTVKLESQEGKNRDQLKWSLIAILLLAGLISNYYYSEVSFLLRMLGGLVVCVVAGYIASKTLKGKWAIDFFNNSRMELRKVVWPSRDETIQTTMVVVVMVIV